MAPIMLAACLTQATATAAGDGKWTLYPSFSQITEIEPAGNSAYVLASNGVFSYNTTDGSITTYDKANTLSDVEAKHIAWSKTEGKLVIAYANSNIDLLAKDGSVTNVPDLYMKTATYDKSINDIYLKGRYAYISTAFGIMKLDVAEASIPETYQLGFSVDYCYVEGRYVYAQSRSAGLYRGDVNDNLLDKKSWQWVGEYTPKTTDRTNVHDTSTGYWWTTTEDGSLTYYKLDESGNRTYMTEGVMPDGPASNNFYRLYVNDGRLYGLGGMYDPETDANRQGEVHVWDGESWSEFDKVSEEEIGHKCLDFVSLDFDPRDNSHVMVGAKSGLYEFKDMKLVNHYNFDNSQLRSAVAGSKDYTIVMSVKYDPQGNLWALNPDGSNSIKKLAADGTWTTYTHNDLLQADPFGMIGLFISKASGRMWFINSNYQKNTLFSYDYAKDALEGYGPDIINQDGAGVSAKYIYDPTEDKEGNVWIGTSAGPLYMRQNSDGSGDGVFMQHKVPRNDGTNYADYLLANNDVRAIAVDGGNRKWMGTNSAGVFLISSDNNTQISHFTTDNSPLPSNIILDIAIDGATGRVYLATDKGLCSYMGDTTEPSDAMDKDNVYAYPNPVRPGYDGLITVVGLSYDADVKIVTANGTLVNQGRSNGGSYTWDGNDLDGKRVASGIYMVQTATSDGGKGTVCKIAVIN